MKRRGRWSIGFSGLACRFPIFMATETVSVHKIRPTLGFHAEERCPPGGAPPRQGSRLSGTSLGVLAGIFFKSVLTTGTAKVVVLSLIGRLCGGFFLVDVHSAHNIFCHHFSPFRFETNAHFRAQEDAFNELKTSPPSPLSTNGLRRAHQRFTLRRRKAFPTTETELKLMAAAAMMGLKRSPTNG